MLIGCHSGAKSESTDLPERDARAIIEPLGNIAYPGDMLRRLDARYTSEVTAYQPACR